MTSTPRRPVRLRFALLAAAVLCSGLLMAGDAPPATAPSPWVWSGDAAGLHHLSLCQLDDLYRRASITTPPHGWLPGQVIAFTNMPAPKMIKGLSDTFWVGKHIEPDGYFINQWRNRRALDSYLRVGPSYVDGCPCIVFEYPRWTPLFGPMRDEYREIAPGLFLGRMYRRVPKVRFLGFNYLQLSTTCCACQLTPAAALPAQMPVAAMSALSPVAPPHAQPSITAVAAQLPFPTVPAQLPVATVPTAPAVVPHNLSTYRPAISPKSRARFWP